MSKIRIKNFGPIKEGYIESDGWMDIKKVTVFIGDQGSGKSTVAKLFSSFSWFEKALNRGDFDNTLISERQFIDLLAYQRIENYLTDRTEIDFIGEAYNIKFRTAGTSITKKVANNYVVPKIMYVPAERNFLSTIASAFDVKGLPGPLTTFAEELKRANIDLDGVKINLPIGDYAYRYDFSRDISQIYGPDYTINLLEASSGLQSLIPLFLVSKNLANSITNAGDDDISVNQRIRREQEINKVSRDVILSEEEKDKKILQIKARFQNNCFINIVEEPEQNLFPASQRQLLNGLWAFNNVNAANKLVMATHSPYVINYLSIAIQGDELKKKILSAEAPATLLERLNNIVPASSAIAGTDVAIYELQDGKIIRLPDYQGIPSDKNYLNQSLAEGNGLFDSLLEIEQEL